MGRELFNPAQMIESMRDSGYKNTAYAIAELVDNSIEANASEVYLLCLERKDRVQQRWRWGLVHIAVLDNGHGMDREVLHMALQFANGTRLSREQRKGIGRFGMGLPNASISQAKRVEVWSWQYGIQNALRCYLDVDEVRGGKMTDLADPQPASLPRWLSDMVPDYASATGTLVVWSKLDRIQWKTGRALIDHSDRLLGRIYRRFLHEGRAKITAIVARINEVGEVEDVVAQREILPNDPLFLMSPTSTPEPYDKEPMFEEWGEPIERTLHGEDGREYRVRARFSLVRRVVRENYGMKNPGNAPFGRRAEENMGVSIVRADREIELDLSLVHDDSTERWWGCEVEFEPGLDEVFGLTNNKQGVPRFQELARKAARETDSDWHRTIHEEEDASSLTASQRELYEFITEILKQLRKIRRELRKQRTGARSVHAAVGSVDLRGDEGIDPAEREATELAKKHAEQGQESISRLQEDLAVEERVQLVAEVLKEAGADDKEAEQTARRYVLNDVKFMLKPDYHTNNPAFFEVLSVGGEVVVKLNANHPFFDHLYASLHGEDEMGDDEVEYRLVRASNALRLLLLAWALMEDETTDDDERYRLGILRQRWGVTARELLADLD